MVTVPDVSHTSGNKLIYLYFSGHDRKGNTPMCTPCDCTSFYRAWKQTKQTKETDYSCVVVGNRLFMCRDGERDSREICEMFWNRDGFPATGGLFAYVPDQTGKRISESSAGWLGALHGMWGPIGNVNNLEIDLLFGSNFDSKSHHHPFALAVLERAEHSELLQKDARMHRFHQDEDRATRHVLMALVSFPEAVRHSGLVSAGREETDSSAGTQQLSENFFIYKCMA